MKRTCDFTINQIFIYTLLLGIIASLLHYAYDFSGGNLLVGLFSPVNESVWEHLKLMFFPLLIWWIIIYQINKDKCETNLNTWIVSAAVSLVAAPLLVVLFFYSYTGALGIHSVFIDVLLVFICYFIAILLASHLLKYSNANRYAAFISIISIIIIFALFFVFTINPPELPIFFDRSR